MIDADQLARITAKLKPRIVEAEEEARRFRPAPLSDLAGSIVGEHAGERWAGLSVSQRRALMLTLNIEVTLFPAGSNGRAFDPSTIKVAPRGSHPEGVAQDVR